MLHQWRGLKPKHGCMDYLASLKEIRAKVASIKSTQKITRAMQMVAASKMRRPRTYATRSSLC